MRVSFWEYMDNQGWSTWLTKLLFFCAIVLALVNFVAVMSAGAFSIWRAIIVPALWIFGTYRLMTATDRDPTGEKAILTVVLFVLLISAVVISLII